MLPAHVAESYDRIATQWTSPGFDQSNAIEQHKRAISFTSLRGTALDVGCGSSGRLFNLLRSKGFAAEGLDLSAEMLRLVREADPSLVLHHADICDWTAPRPYDFISAWDSIWHVPLMKQRSVLLKLCAALTTGGVIIFTAGGVESPGELQDEHMGVPMYHASLGVPTILNVLAEGECALRHFEYDQYPQAHVYFIAQRV
jgi:SAM-dependent methyltransferase